MIARGVLVAMVVLAVAAGCDDSGGGGVPLCGNGVIDGGEECDGTNVGDVSCESLGYYGGTLRCTASCRYDLTECMEAGWCGDGTVQTSHGERCEGYAPVGMTCADLGLEGTAQIRCNPYTCDYDTSVCGDSTHTGSCGNGIEEDGEICDSTCQDYGILKGWECAGCTSCSYLIEFATPGQDMGYRVAWAGASEIYYLLALVQDRCHVFRMEDGNITWDVQLSDATCVPGAIAVGEEGVFVSYAEQRRGGYGGMVVRLEMDGRLSWRRPIPYDSASLITAMKLKDGILYVTGYTDTDAWGAWRGGLDVLLGTLDPFGGEWIDTFQFGQQADEVIAAMDVDDDGSIYLAGWTTGTFCPEGTDGTGGDALLMKLGSVGIVWCHQWGTGSFDGLLSLVRDGTALYCAGFTEGSLFGESMGGRDAVLAAVDTSGTVVWSRQYGSVVDDYASSVAVTYGTVAVAFSGGVLSSPTTAATSFPDVGIFTVSPETGLIATERTVLEGNSADGGPDMVVHTVDLYGREAIRAVLFGTTTSTLTTEPAGSTEGYLMIVDWLR